MTVLETRSRTSSIHKSGSQTHWQWYGLARILDKCGLSWSGGLRERRQSAVPSRDAGGPRYRTTLSNGCIARKDRVHEIFWAITAGCPLLISHNGVPEQMPRRGWTWEQQPVAERLRGENIGPFVSTEANNLSILRSGPQ